MLCPACDHDNIAGTDLCEDCGMDLAGLDVQAWGVSPQDPLLVKELRHLPLKDPLIVKVGSPVSEAIDLMRDRGEGCVFVKDGRRLVGIVSERDVTARVAAPGRHPAHTHVEEVMTPRPAALREGDALAWALHRLGVEGHRHLAVMRGDELTGFLSVRTVLKSLCDA